MSPAGIDSVDSALTQQGGETRLLGSQCDVCDNVSFPYRLWCPNCGTQEVTEIPFEQTGRLETYSVIRVPQEGFEAPYAVGFVRLSPGNVRVFGPIDAAFDKLEIGQNFVVTMLSPEDGIVPTEMWGFAPASTEGCA